MKKLFSLLIVFVATGLFTFAQTSLKVTNTGVGIGTSTPTEKLEVDGLVKTKGATYRETGASATALYERTDRSAMLVGAGAQPGFTFDQNFKFLISANNRSAVLNRILTSGSANFLMSGDGITGYMGFGIVNATERIHAVGNIFATGIITPSDRNLKDNVTPFSDGLLVIKNLNTIRYTYNGKAGLETDDVHIGVYAQELQEVAPYLVEEFVHTEVDGEGNPISEETFLKIRDGEIKYLLVNAVKEQQEMIEQQQKLIEQLQSQMQAYSALLEKAVNEKLATR